MSPARRSVPIMPRVSWALDNLRAFVILLVLSFHSVLAYLDFLPGSPFAFDAPPYLWRAFPVVDHERWFGFDLFCAWQDVFLMSLFFFLSGLFVWPSLERKGARIFLHDRVLRLGVPFALVVALLMPLANYPTYLQTTADPSFAGIGVGACGIERGLFAPEGALVRHWVVWPIAAVGLLLLWMALTALTMTDSGAPALWLQAFADLSFVLACFGSCFAVLALVLRFAGRRLPALAGLKRDAFGMYLVHYGFIVWLQYALLGFGLFAMVKGSLVFAGTVLLSC